MLRLSKRFTLTLGVVLALALSPIIQAQTGKRLALVQVNQQALYFTQITQGAQAAAKAAGAELVVFNAMTTRQPRTTPSRPIFRTRSTPFWSAPSTSTVSSRRSPQPRRRESRWWQSML